MGRLVNSKFIKQSLLTLGVICLSVLGGQIPSVEALDTVNPQDTVIGPFGGLNTKDNPAIIGSNQAQDMLNVDIAPGGKSVKKRQGFGLDATLAFSTTAVHGTYKFYDTSGNEVRLVGQDVGLYSSVAGASFVRVATGTLSATWQCTDWLGQAYCVTSSRDTPVRTDGTTGGTTYQGTIPAGTCIASTADRLLVGNTAANPNRLYYSGSTNFTDFTLGVLTTSSSFEDITAPGAQITHLAYHYGYWMWWKNQSFGFFQGTGQFDLNSLVVSDTVGTFDNTDIFWEGMTYFRGTDAHIYQYDGSRLTPMTRDITPTVTSANRRKANSWVQSSQSDFASGRSVPQVNISTTISVGDVTVSSFSAVENSSTQWNSGSRLNLTVGVSSLSVTLSNGNLPNNSMEQDCGGGGVVPCEWSPNALLVSPYWARVSQSIGAGACGTSWSGQVGTWFLETVNTQSAASSPKLVTTIWTLSGGTTIYTDTINMSGTATCTFSTETITVSNSDIGKRVQIVFTATDSSGATNDTVIGTTNSFVLAGNIGFKYAWDTTGGNPNAAIDWVTGGSNTVNAGSYTSPVYNTGFTSSTVQINGFNWTPNASTPTFSLVTSTASNGSFATVLTSSGTNAIANQYVRLISTITVSATGNGLTSISSFTILARSTGTYYSAVNNASALTSWNTLNVTDTWVGGSSITYYTRSSTNSFTVLSSTPTWVAQPRNATVAASTGTFFQLRGDFSVTAATENPTLSDFTFNWYEGNASDKMYGIYFDYGLLFSVSLGTTTTGNNRVLRYDLLNGIWTVYDLSANGFLTYNNSLYFGSSSVGKLYKFGNNVTSDDNVAINSYWKSKDFFGATPFNDEDLRSVSWYLKASSGTLNVTYQINQSTQTTYNINLSNGSSTVLRHNRNFLAGTLVNTINFKFGDNSTNAPWELWAGQFTFIPRPWNASQ